MKPLILVTSTFGYNPVVNQSAFLLNQNYLQAVVAGGGMPVIAGSSVMADEYAQTADGLIITGGEGVHPARYGETYMHLLENDPTLLKSMATGGNVPRDEMEFGLFEAFKRAQKPILGICRGHQLIAAACGGKLNPFFSRKGGVEHANGISHEVTALPDSLLGKLFGEKFYVNSFHFDCARELGDEMRATAYSPDGVIEAIEHKTLPIFGVQFHPERMRGDSRNPAAGPDSTVLFEYFVNLCHK